MDTFAPKQYLWKQIKYAAQDKHIAVSPRIKLLIEAIGDTVESDIHDTGNEATALKLIYIIDDITYADNFYEMEVDDSYTSVEEWNQYFVQGSTKGEPPPNENMLIIY